MIQNSQAIGFVVIYLFEIIILCLFKTVDDVNFEKYA